MRIFVIGLVAGILSTHPVAGQNSTLPSDSNYVYVDTVTGKIVLEATPLMNSFLERFRTGSSFDYQKLFREDGLPLEGYVQTTIDRAGLETNWRGIEYEKAVGLYICTQENQLEYLSEMKEHWMWRR